jgi:hypothetical protein
MSIMVRGLLFGILLLQSACAQSYVRFEPPPPEDPGVIFPAAVHLKLKEKVALKGTEGNRKLEREFSELKGDLVSWDVGVLTVGRGSGGAKAEVEWKFEVPVEYIKRMDVRGGDSSSPFLGCLTGAGAMTLVILLSFLPVML